MGTVNVTLGDGKQLNLILGQQLENAVTAVVFDFSAWQTELGSGTLGLSVQRHGDTQPYAVVPTVSGTNATWNISELDTAYKGVGEVQVTYTVGSVVKKSTVYKFTVYRSLGENGEYPSPGQTWQEEIEDELADVKQDFNTQNERNFNSLSIFEPSLVSVLDLEQGGLSSDGLNMPDNSAYRVRSKCYIPVDANKIYSFYLGNQSGMDVSISWYTNNDFKTNRTSYMNWLSMENHDAYLVAVPSGVKYARILLRYKNDAFTTPLPVSDLLSKNLYFQKANYGLNEKGMYYSLGNLYADSAWINRSANAINTPLLNTGTVILPDKSSALISFYNNGDYIGKLNANYEVDKVGGSWGRLTGKISIEKLLSEYSASHLIVVISTTDISDPITSSNYADWGKRNVFFTNDGKLIDYLETEIHPQITDYVVGTDLVKRSIGVNNLGKQILGWQSFCKYGNVYYSYDGTYFYTQNSDFELITRWDHIDLGHGNSLQLGSGKYAYASGWDDNKVYKVDLENLVIADTYTLPVSGYTTCAVDDLNNLMYIFYRATYPSTEANYEFIVWDYINNSIISRKYINSFAGMQSCDYYDGKIVVAYGLADTATGIFVYNTIGDVIASYNIDVLNGNEPEGVFFNRTDKVLYFSDVNKNVYTITT